MKHRILVTQINRPPGYSIARALIKGGHAEMAVGATIHPPGILIKSSKIFDAVVHLPLPKDLDNPDKNEQYRLYVDRVIELCKRYELNAVWPGHDEEIRAIALYKTVLEGIGIFCFVNDRETTVRALDKFQVSNIAQRVGFPSPQSFPFTDDEEELPRHLRYPAIIKANSSSASTGVMKVFNERALREHGSRLIREYGNAHIEEYIPGNEEISINAVRYADGTLACCFGLRKFRYIHPSWSTSCQIIELEDETVEQTKRLLNALEIIGPLAIQTKTDSVSGEMKLVEVNQRFGGIARVLIPSVPGLCSAAYLSLLNQQKMEVRPPIGQHGVSVIDDALSFIVYILHKIFSKSDPDNAPPTLINMLRSYWVTYTSRPKFDDYTTAILREPMFALGFLIIVVKYEWKLPKNWRNLIPWGSAGA